MQEEKVIGISWSTILKISLAVVLFYTVYRIKEVLAWLMFALIISVLAEPAIRLFKRHRISRPFAAAILYLGLLGIIFLVVYLTIPLLVNEVNEFSKVLPQYFEDVSPGLKLIGLDAFSDIEAALKTLETSLNDIAKNAFNALFALFGGIFTTFFILTVAFFLSLEEKGPEHLISIFFPPENEAYVLSLWQRCEKKIANWFVSRIIACVFVGILSYIAFLILNIPYPFTMALLSGVFNFVPVIGPVVTGIILFTTTALTSALKGVFVVVVFILIQQIENNILTPIISKKLVDLSPVLVLVSLAIGGILWGLPGALLATPIFGILAEFLEDYLKKTRGGSSV